MSGSRAAQYVRMSTEHQRYSVEAQSISNAAYAAEHGLLITKTYLDAGISGVTLRQRDGLKSLLHDVLRGDAGYDVILVLDVSRWGRFQDPDQAAHYEFLCRQSGVRVEYTREAFTNDGSLATTLVKHLKRVMAAEYSRELSTRISFAKQSLAKKGYWQGGEATYGFRRRVIHADGGLGPVLQIGERKGRQGDRTILVEGPEAEIAVVRRIFSEYVVHGFAIRRIVARLNADGIAAARGRAWSYSAVIRMLRDEKYAGVMTAGQTVSRFRKVSAGERLRLPGACPQLVNVGYVELAALNLRRMPKNPTDDALLDGLRQLWRRQGRLSQRILLDEPLAYSPTVYQRRFGGMMNAYRKIGYPTNRHQRAAEVARLGQTKPPFSKPRFPMTDAEMLEGARALFERHGRLNGQLINLAEGLPTASTYRDRFGSLQAVYAAVGYNPNPIQQRLFNPGVAEDETFADPEIAGRTV